MNFDSEDVGGRVGDDLMRSPHRDIEVMVAISALNNGLPECRRGGQLWSCFQSLSPSMQRSVEDHEQA